ncbi:uncharacterized protein LOC144508328 [Mustelus asterias]
MINPAREVVAAVVSVNTLQSRTGIQCQEGMNDLLCTARDKLAHNKRERSQMDGAMPEMIILMDFEERALQLAEEEADRSCAKGEMGGNKSSTSGEQPNASASHVQETLRWIISQRWRSKSHHSFQPHPPPAQGHTRWNLVLERSQGH